MIVQDLFGPSTISLNGEVNASMVTLFDQGLQKHATGDRPPITLLVTSLGGSVPFGRAIAERLRLFNTSVRTVNLVGVGCIGSSATFIPLALPRSQRFLTRDTNVTLHQFSIEFTLPRQVLIGAESVSQEMVKDVANLRQVYDNYVRRLAREMHRSVRTVRKMVDGETILTAKEAVQLGLFQSIIG